VYQVLFYRGILKAYPYRDLYHFLEGVPPRGRDRPEALEESGEIRRPKGRRWRVRIGKKFQKVRESSRKLQKPLGSLKWVAAHQAGAAG
jgi:hypothetical protein